MKLKKIIEIAEHDLNEGVNGFNPIQDEGWVCLFFWGGWGGGKNASYQFFPYNVYKPRT